MRQAPRTRIVGPRRNTGLWPVPQRSCTPLFLIQRQALFEIQRVTNPLGAQTRSLCSGCRVSHDYPPHPRANPRNNFPRNGSRLFSEFRAGDFLPAVAPHENNVVTDLNTLYVTN